MVAVKKRAVGCEFRSHTQVFAFHCQEFVTQRPIYFIEFTHTQFSTVKGIEYPLPSNARHHRAAERHWLNDESCASAAPVHVVVRQRPYSYSSDPCTQMNDWMSIMSRGRRSPWSLLTS